MQSHTFHCGYIDLNHDKSWIASQDSRFLKVWPTEWPTEHNIEMLLHLKTVKGVTLSLKVGRRLKTTFHLKKK